MWLGDLNNVMHRKRDLGEFEKSQLVEILPRKKKVDFRLLTVALQQGTHVIGGGDGKVRCISLPYVEKTFNSKVIKSFVPELRSHKCFFVFRDSYVIYMNILCTFHIFMFGYITSVNWNIRVRNIGNYLMVYKRMS